MTLFHAALTSFYAFRHLVNIQPTKMDHCPLLFFGANEIRIVHVNGKKLMTEMDYQGRTCTTMVEDEETVCSLSCPTSSIANCKTCIYSADNFLLTYVV
jgi:hypothetical protein